MPLAHRQQRHIGFEIAGQGPAVLLVPGTGAGARQFGSLPKRFAREGFTCVTFDPAGTGESHAPPGPFDFEDAARDLVAVLDAAKLRTSALVGTSLGGKVALVAAALEPQRIDRLVTLATSFVKTPRSERIYRFFEVAARKLDAGDLGAVLAPFLFGSTFWDKRRDLAADIARGLRPDTPTRALIAAQASALAAFDGREHAARVRCPALCLAGAEDVLTSAADVAASAALLTRGRCEVLEGVGHSLLLESPEAFTLVVRFLKEQE